MHRPPQVRHPQQPHRPNQRPQQPHRPNQRLQQQRQAPPEAPEVAGSSRP
jgi:hypothetical protein